MAQGYLVGRIVLDDSIHIHCGTGDPVKGHVEVTYRPVQDEETVKYPTTTGPLHVQVSLYGQSVTRQFLMGLKTSTAPLFHVSSILHNGTFPSPERETHIFRFSLSFPQCTQSMSEQAAWAPDFRFQSDHGGPLPPTFRAPEGGFNHTTSACVEYRVKATLAMPEMNFEVLGLDPRDEPFVFYDQPRISPSKMTQKSVLVKQYASIKNKILLPEAERSVGLVQNAKAIFTRHNLPEYHFQVFTKYPQHLYLGQPLRFEVTVWPQLELCTAPIVPEIKLGEFTGKIYAHTTTRMHGSPYLQNQDSGYHALQLFYGELEEGTEATFPKDQDHTKRIRAFALSGVTSSFTTYNVVRQYTMEIRYNLFTADRAFSITRLLPVTVHSWVQDEAQDSGKAVANSSAAPANSEKIPPAYEPPPAYAEVVEVDDRGARLRSNNIGKEKKPVS